MGWCCWRALNRACTSARVIPCLTPSAPVPTACRSLFSVTTLLLTSMPSPRCPSYPECPSPASHPANSSFKTRLRGLLREALPAPSRLGKMLPVCLHRRTHHMSCVISSHVCVLPPPHPQNWIMLLQGKGQLLLSSAFRPTVYHRECLLKC